MSWLPLEIKANFGILFKIFRMREKVSSAGIQQTKTFLYL